MIVKAFHKPFSNHHHGVHPIVDKAYQFKITLKGIKPPIWRRIQVPETYTFWDLHVAIQDAMGWEDYHLHKFEMRHSSTGENVRIGTPN